MARTSTDVVETLGRSTVQHGPASDRVYLMRLDPADMPGIMERVDALARENGYTKVFAKVPGWAREPFEERGYQLEALVPGFFNGREDCAFMGRYRDVDRVEPCELDALETVLQTAQGKDVPDEAPALDSRFKLRVMTPEDAGEMAALYGRVFDSYPFPITDPAYIRETMESHVRYFGVFEGKTLAALSSAEMDEEAGNAEMTDFATGEEYRGDGLASVLLTAMDRAMREEGIYTAYTICRAAEYGANIIFAKRGYVFAGCLPNNTQIGGGLESMNVWYKPLRPAG